MTTKATYRMIEGAPVNVLDFGAVGDGITDDRAAIQAAIDYIEAGDVRRTLYAPSDKNFYMGSTVTVPESGEQACLILRNVNKVWIDFNGSRITDGVAATKQTVLAIVPTGVASDYAFGNVRGLWIEGNQTVRPYNVLKADYGEALAYCRFEDMRLRYAEHDIWRMDGFVIKMSNIRCSFSATGSGIHAANGSGAANTGYNMDSCTVDFVKIYGFRLSGANGHTYCHINNCYADFAGRDDSKTTYPDEVGRAAGFRLENVRVVNLTACGTEFCTQVLSTNNARAVTIDGLYSLGSGHSDGTTEVPWRWKVEGFTERMTISGVQFNSAASPATNIVEVVPVNAYNENSIAVMDGSLRKDYFFINGAGTETSGNMPMISTPENLYNGNMRKGAGDALVTGVKLEGSFATEWFNQSLVAAEQTFLKSTGGAAATYELAEFTNTTATGAYLAIKVEMVLGKLDGATPEAPVTYVGSLARGPGSWDTQAMTLVGPDNAAITAPTIAQVGNRLRVTNNTTFSVASIKCTAIGRKGGGVQTMEWLPGDAV